MRLTKRHKLNELVGYTVGDMYMDGYQTIGTPITKLGQLEDIEELCIKMTTQPIYEKFFKTNICKLDFIGCNTAYDFKNNCIIVYKDSIATIYFINRYGKTWALTKEELL